MALYQVEGTALTRRSLRVETPAQIESLTGRPSRRERVVAGRTREEGRSESRAAEFKDLILIVIAVAATLLLDLFLFT
jgi:hypothetical protein